MKVLITDRSGKGGHGERGLKGRVRALAGHILKGLDLNGREVSILLTTDEEIKELNTKYRSKERATDVLSFPMNDPELLGDVVISIERARDQARRYGCSEYYELSRLLVHGTLHLLGYDHENGGRQAAKMKRKEEELLAALKADGLI
jgi:probable rRNA maturation factor